MIEYRVKKIVAENFSVTIESVQNTTTFAELPGDSLDEIEALMAVEDEFGILIDDAIAEGLVTVQLVIDHVTAATRRMMGYATA